MKNLLFIIIFSSIVFTSLAQDKDGIYFTPSPVHRLKTVSVMQIDLKNHSDSLEYQISHVRYCLGKCRDEKMIGYAFQFTGITAGIAVGLSNSENPDALLIASGIIALVGTVMVIDSEKWLKRAYIGPNGFGVKFLF